MKLKLLTAVLVADMMFAPLAHAQWGMGLYGANQPCPYGYGTAGGAFSDDDEISELMRERVEARRQRMELRRELKEVQKSADEHKKQIEDGIADRYRSRVIEHMESRGNCCGLEPLDGPRGGGYRRSDDGGEDNWLGGFLDLPQWHVDYLAAYPALSNTASFEIMTHVPDEANTNLVYPDGYVRKNIASSETKSRTPACAGCPPGQTQPTQRRQQPPPVTGFSPGPETPVATVPALPAPVAQPTIPAPVYQPPPPPPQQPSDLPQMSRTDCVARHGIIVSVDGHEECKILEGRSSGSDQGDNQAEDVFEGWCQTEWKEEFDNCNQGRGRMQGGKPACASGKEYRTQRWIQDLCEDGGGIKASACSNPRTRMKGGTESTISNCASAIGEYRRDLDRVKDLRAQITKNNAEIDSFRSRLREAKNERREMAKLEAECPECFAEAGGWSSGHSRGPSTLQTIGTLGLGALGAFLGYKASNYSTDKAAKLGFPTSGWNAAPFVAGGLGLPFAAAGLYGAIGGGVNGGFGCSGSIGGGGFAGGPYGMASPWAGAYGGMGGLGGGMFMPGMGPWGMAGPWGGGAGIGAGIGIGGMPMSPFAGGLASGYPISPYGGVGAGFASPFGSFPISPIGGFAISPIGGGMPISPFGGAMGGMPISPMGGMAISPFGGMPFSPIGGMAMSPFGGGMPYGQFGGGFLNPFGGIGGMPISSFGGMPISPYGIGAMAISPYGGGMPISPFGGGVGGIGGIGGMGISPYGMMPISPYGAMGGIGGMGGIGAGLRQTDNYYGQMQVQLNLQSQISTLYQQLNTIGAGGIGGYGGVGGYGMFGLGTLNYNNLGTLGTGSTFPGSGGTRTR